MFFLSQINSKNNIYFENNKSIKQKYFTTYFTCFKMSSKKCEDKYYNNKNNNYLLKHFLKSTSFYYL